jgi:hypothetical protein
MARLTVVDSGARTQDYTIPSYRILQLYWPSLPGCRKMSRGLDMPTSLTNVFDQFSW